LQAKQHSLLVLAFVLALAASVVLAPRAGARGSRSAAATREAVRAINGRIERQRAELRHWLGLMRKPMPAYAHSVARSSSLRYDHWVLSLWTQRTKQARRDVKRPPHRAAWLCIHSGEASWTDPNPPYYGGLQMDYGFQQTYGRELLRRKGTADHWTPLEQMWVAERAFTSGRGFWPWPSTARRCGLI
jgi:hypothetical protein